MLESILAWIAEKILKYLLNLAAVKLEETAADLKQDQERKVTNDANIKAYNEANTRADRIKAATDLLNRTRR